MKEFGEAFKNYKRKTKRSEMLIAADELIEAAKKVKSSGEDLGNYAGLVENWAKAEVARNKYRARTHIQFNS